jgi:hypothetical protein
VKITPRQVRVREVFDGYADKDEVGVIGLGGRLDIRPPYQREFVYSNDKRDKVVQTVLKGFPLNVMYWARNPDPNAPEDESRAKYEVLDGQQRTLSLCQYLSGKFSLDEQYFKNLPQDRKDALLDYELTVYVCEGPESEKLEWFRTINIAGEKLTDQELLNAAYTGPWLLSAKTYFSKTNCPAFNLASDYLSGSPIRQDYLETALNWISGGKPERYMAQHQTDKTAIELWNHFTSVINWVKATFTMVRREMHAVNWGELYARHKDEDLDPKQLEQRVAALMQDEEVTRKAGIYAYVLSGEERHLSLRAFSANTRREAYTRQGGVCANQTCPQKGKVFKEDEMEADHLDPWHAGGRTVASNCRLLCKSCNRRKGGV